MAGVNHEHCPGDSGFADHTQHVCPCSGGIARVPAGYEVIIERLGKFYRLLKPGTHGIFIPFVDRAAKSFLRKLQQFDLPKFVAPHKEDLPFTVVSELRYPILGSMKVDQNVPDPREALIPPARTAVLAVMKQQKGFETIETRRSVENAIQRRIEDGPAAGASK